MKRGIINLFEETGSVRGEDLNLFYLQPILECLQEGAEICDNLGNVVFVNQAFLRQTGLKDSDQVGSNVFEDAPGSPLAQALVSGKPVYRQRTEFHGQEVVANALPVFIEGQLAGGIMTWIPVTETTRIHDDLTQYKVLTENLYSRLRQLAGAKYSFESVIGSSKSTRQTVEAAKKAAKTDNSVLLLGEAGTGKNLFAQAIHHASRRRDKPFITLNTNSLLDSMLEDELFGNDKGIFPGTVKSKIGCFELANGGTLFLDEIANLSLFLQDKLLRVLEHWEFFRVGGTMPIKVDVRIISSSNRDLRGLVQEGKFREQLFNRLNEHELLIPSLRQRREDIPQFVNYFISRYNRKFGKNLKGVSAQGLQILMGYEWPGNVRELALILERAIVSANDSLLTHTDLAEYLSNGSGGLMQLHDIMPLERMEEILLRAALARYGESLDGKKKASQALNISLATLYNKLKKYDI